MKKLATLFSILALSISCDRIDSPDLDTPSEEPSIPLTSITITSAFEQPSGTTKTSLGDGNMVLWSSDDSFDLLPVGSASSGVKDVLVATVNGTSQGLGIPVSGSGNYYVKYDGIKITVDGSDVTNAITGTSSGSSNTYKLGVCYQSGNNQYIYRYLAAGTSFQGTINTSKEDKYCFPLVQSSSSTTIKNGTTATVQISGIQISSDGNIWDTIDERTTLYNGSEWGKDDVTYEWQSRSGSTSLVKTTSAITSGAGTASASFNAEIAEGATYYAFYPASSSNSLSDGSISFSLPSTQSYSVGSFANGANPAVGVLTNDSGDYSVAFKNICGVLKLRLKGSQVVSSIEVTDPTETHSLWGQGTMDINAIGEGYASVSGGSNKLTLDCGAGVQLSTSEATDFYLVVPVGSFSEGLEIAVNTSFGTATKATTVANTISRSVIKTMPAFSTDRLEFVTQEFNIENPAAAEYLANSTTTLSSTSSNYGESFFNLSRSYRPDQPNTKTITFSSTASTATVVMSEHKDFSSPVLSEQVTLNGGSGSYELRNMVPGRTYYYSVSAGGEVLTSGAFTTTGQLRMIAVDMGFNIRDLGGWTGMNGNKVRYETVYRGASLGGTDMDGNSSDITAEDKEELYRIGIRAQLDLRAATNSGKYSGESSLHSYSAGVTTLLNADFNNTMTDYGAYNQDASVVADMAWIIYELKRGKPVYFNCRQGADRTGTIAFIIEGLLGCYGSDTGRQMGMDYELTGFSQADLIDNKKVGSSYRAATEAYGNTSKLFRALLLMSSSEVSLSTVQEKCYYYLNKYWASSGKTIDKADLDWFINYMLGIIELDGTLSSGHTSADLIGAPSWAVSTGTDLKVLGESMANVVSYITVRPT